MDCDRWSFSDHSRSWGDRGSFCYEGNMIVAHNFFVSDHTAKPKKMPKLVTFEIQIYIKSTMLSSFETGQCYLYSIRSSFRRCFKSHYRDCEWSWLIFLSLIMIVNDHSSYFWGLKKGSFVIMAHEKSDRTILWCLHTIHNWTYGISKLILFLQLTYFLDSY